LVFGGVLSSLTDMDPRVKHVVAFISKNYHRKLTLKEMADSVNLSTWWLCHLFREHLDTSPDRLLTQVRMKKARELLENSFLTVKEVRTEVGIRDASTFTRGFKAEFGVTPAKCRERTHKR